jgi:hypothetical protein
LKKDELIVIGGTFDVFLVELILFSIAKMMRYQNVLNKINELPGLLATLCGDLGIEKHHLYSVAESISSPLLIL